MPVSDTLIDTLFDGRYRIIRRLGAGGMANVYLAEDQELGRRVAIKILNDRHANDEQFVERFRREAKNAAGLSHPNIVSIYDRGEAEGTYYIAMEHLDGRNLKELINARGPAPVRVAIDYARQILSALRFAHRNKIVHRDIKPHNVLDDGDGRLKVTDFGIARAGASQMTEAGSIVGTAQYLSPEQARGTQVDQRSDVYSLGVVLYELLTGRVPFTGDTPVEIAMKHLSSTPPLPSTLRPDIPRDLDLIVMRALAKDPDERYQTAEEMDADLARVAAGIAVSPETTDAATAIISRPSAMPTTITRAPTRVRETVPTRPYAEPPPYYEYDDDPRRPRPIWPWLVTLLLVLAAAAFGWYVYNQIQDQLDETKPVAVPFLEGRRESLAVNELIEKQLEYRVVRKPSGKQPVGFVFDQDPDPGDRIDRATDEVTIYVSSGPPKATVPDVRGDTRDEAVAELTARKLKPRVVEINSEKEVNTVTAQSPAPGERVNQGSTVRINVSRGPKPIGIPSVVGQPYESAAATLQAAGLAVARRDVESTEARGIVVDQDPSGGAFVARRSTLTLRLSKGPATSSVPHVKSLHRETAAETLRSSRVCVRQATRNTDVPSLENVVLEQSPGGGTQARPGTAVTITVGRYVEPEPTVEPPETEPFP